MLKTKRILKNIIVFSSLSTALFVCASCSKTNSETREKDYGVMPALEDKFDATINSIVSTDVYGRSFDEGDVATSDKKVGMFYFVWHGMHVDNGIFDVTKLMQTEEGTQILWAQDETDKTVSPLNEFHYFSEPLYGYYCSDDPWLLARHIELLTMNGIDYISLDLTNISIYEKNVRAVLEALLKYQKQGWKVPLVTSFTTGTDISLNHPQRVLDFYNIFYADPRYDSLWFRDDATGKPIIAIDRANYYGNLNAIVTANLKIRNTIWPYDRQASIYDDASWLDWTYPQRVYENSDGNYMSVSVAQHVAGSFGVSVNPNIKDDPNVRTQYAEMFNRFDTGGETNYDSNRGRGWDYSLNKNVKENVFKGTNLETQWENAINPENSIDEAFVTGWNEWVAYKLKFEHLHGGDPRLDEIYGKYYDQVSFCDQCDEEFSRDLEMTKGGYGDNFYLQNMRLTRKFKFDSQVKYAGEYASASLTNLNWENAREYLDFTEEAFARDFDRADHKEKYTNNTNRNDIKATRMSHDGNNLYIQIETNNNIIIDRDASNNLNVLLSIKDSELPAWEGYNFILNRNPLTSSHGMTNLEKVATDGEFAFEEVAECKTYLKDNVVSISIPLDKLGLKDVSDFTIDFKVADGVSDMSDMMNYYIDGDVAPIGRLNYRYNSEHFDK